MLTLTVAQAINANAVVAKLLGERGVGIPIRARRYLGATLAPALAGIEKEVMDTREELIASHNVKNADGQYFVPEEHTAAFFKEVTEMLAEERELLLSPVDLLSLASCNLTAFELANLDVVLSVTAPE